MAKKKPVKKPKKQPKKFKQDIMSYLIASGIPLAW